MKIGILQTGHTAEALRGDHGDYPDLFERLLEGHGLSFATYDVEALEFPASADEADGWLITGSRHGVYDDLPMIGGGEAFIRAAYARSRPLVGICFGHQLVAQALGGMVEKFEGGWAVGPTRYQIEGQQVTLNAWHQDQVILPPESATPLGGNDFCRYGALRYGDRAYTLQAHPEFDPVFMADMIEKRGPGLVPQDRLDAAKARLDTPLDAARIADRIVRFFRERH